jgi:hypothetical protein
MPVPSSDAPGSANGSGWIAIDNVEAGVDKADLLTEADRAALLRHHTGETGADDESVDLSRGDALTFAGDRAHRYSNPDRLEARFALTVYEPLGSRR